MAVEDFTFDFGDPSLRGRTVLIAGGSGGLGAATCALLARDGASLIVGYHQDKTRAARLREFLVEHYGIPVELVAGNLIEDNTRKAYLRAADRIGHELYGLVCLVGDPARVKFDQVSVEDLEDSMNGNYSGPVLLARDVAREMRQRLIAGSIVLFSTMQAVALFESSINYAGPKAALIHAARIMAKQWGGKDYVRVNVIAPGVNQAGMALASIASGKYDFLVERDLIPRFGKAEDIAKVVRLLMEPDNYLTGQVITVDGGLTIRRDIG